LSELDRWLNRPEVAGVNFECVEAIKAPIGLNNELLFHLPLLACVVLTLAAQRRRPRTHEVGQIVGECLRKLPLQVDTAR